VLILHGTADPITPVAAVRALAARIPQAELATVHGGRHDVLNDAPHRTVAAHVVQWLERLRTGAVDTPILTVERERP
jgi:alpha-beta hydrolase superfamily lysophospholipase